MDCLPSPSKTGVAGRVTHFVIPATTECFLIGEQPTANCAACTTSSGFRAGKILSILVRRKSCSRESPVHLVQTKPVRTRERRFTAAIFFTNGRARMPKEDFRL